MQYIMTFVWSFVLVQTINFVLTSLGGGTDLHFELATIGSVVFAILVLLIAKTFPNDPIPKHREH